MTLMSAKYIPKGTSVLVADPHFQLRSHIMIHDHRFHDEDLYATSAIKFNGASRAQGPMTSIELANNGFYTLKTRNSEWPYIVVRASRVKMMEIPVRRGKAPRRKA